MVTISAKEASSTRLRQKEKEKEELILKAISLMYELSYEPDRSDNFKTSKEAVEKIIDYLPSEYGEAKREMLDAYLESLQVEPYIDQFPSKSNVNVLPALAALLSVKEARRVISKNYIGELVGEPFDYFLFLGIERHLYSADDKGFALSEDPYIIEMLVKALNGDTPEMKAITVQIFARIVERDEYQSQKGKAEKALVRVLFENKGLFTSRAKTSALGVLLEVEAIDEVCLEACIALRTDFLEEELRDRGFLPGGWDRGT